MGRNVLGDLERYVVRESVADAGMVARMDSRVWEGSGVVYVLVREGLFWILE